MQVAPSGIRAISDVIADCSQFKPEGHLFTDDFESLSAADVAAQVSQISGALLAHGLRKGDRIAFVVGGSVRHAVMFLACLHVGAVPCALHARDSTENMARMYSWLDAVALVVDSTYGEVGQDLLEFVDCRVRVFLGDSAPSSYWATYSELLSMRVQTVSDPPRPDDPAYIILSSGTTGSPKGVVHTHASAFESAMAGAWIYGDISESDKVLMSVTPSFAAWANILFPFLAARSTIHFQNRFDPSRYLDDLDLKGITYAALPPTLWRLVLRESPGPGVGKQLRYAFFSGERGSADLIDDLLRVLPHVRIRSAWLSSEGACGAGLVADHGILVDSGSVSATGRPVPGAVVQIRAPDGSEMGVDDVGELVVSARSIASFYWKDQQLTESRLTDGWWFTGDVGFRDSKGLIHVTGRTDNIINTGGIKVHAEEIEELLLSHTSVSMCAVVGQPDELWGTVIHAYVVTSHALTADDLSLYLRNELQTPGYKVPKAIHFVDSLPQTATGKLFRKGLINSRP